MSKRILAYLLILAMALQICPISVFGTESADQTINDLAVEITHVSLNPGKDALGFKAKVTGSVESVTEIGFCFRVNGGTEKVYTASKTPADGVFTARVKNILASNGGEATLEAYAFVRIGDVTVRSELQTTSMKQTLQTVDTVWNTAGYTQTQKLAVRELCRKYNAQVQPWNLDNIFGSFFGTTGEYTTSSHFDLSEDTGANTGEAIVSDNGIAFGYVDSFAQENFYFETQIHVNGILSTENWPKFGLIVEANGIREYLYVDMTTDLTAASVGRMTNTNEVDDWDNITTATIAGMAFSGAGETITLGVLKDESMLHFFVDGQYALSHLSKIEGNAVTGIFGFNTGMTLTEYFTDLSAETKEAKLALLPDEMTGFFGQTNGYVSTSHMNLTDDTGAHTGTVTVNKEGIALGYINHFFEDDFYFETKFHVNAVKNTEDFPKFGLFVEAQNISEHFYVDMTTTLKSNKVGRVTKTNGVWDWASVSTAKIDTMAFSGTWETVTLGILKDGSNIHFFVDGQYALSHTSNIQGSVVAGIFGFNTDMTLTEYFTDLSEETAAAKLELLPKSYECQIQSQIDALHQEYITENGCAGKGGTLIFGDSNVAFWDTWESQTGLTNYVDGYNVGIADSTVRDWLYAYDQLIAPFAADRFVVLAGANDVKSLGDRAQTVAENLKTLFEKIHADHPNAKIYYIYAIPSPSAYADGIYTNAELGELVSCAKDLCARYDYVYGIDVFDLMVTADRQNSNAELFDADKVQMNEAGYGVFSDHVYEMIFGDDSVITDQITETDKFVLYDGQLSAPILMDAQYNASDVKSSQAYTQVARAVGDLRQDVAMVNGAIDYKIIQQTFMDSDAHQAERLANAKRNMVPALMHTVPEGVTYNYAVIVGAIGESAIIDQIIASGKLPEAQTITGKWEAYVIKEVADPIPGVKNALVIAGSDARGTIYGIYTISETIGVSPYYWYSDVAVQVQDTITLDYDVAFVDDGPDVKYRGIFINDEESSNAWAKVKFNEDTPGTNYYRRVFEMILRLKANTLWPAMHACSVAFNSELDSDGIPVNSKEAAKYGVVMSSSHCDILLRNNVGEWGNWINANAAKYPNISYDFTINEQALLDYWGERLTAVKDFESILPIGIRAIHDDAFECADLDKYPGDTTEEKKVNVLIDVIKKQRELIYEIYGTEPQNIPQVYISYKEANVLYNAGVNDFLAWDGSQDFNGDGVIDWRDDNSDIILMYAEDNQNYLRQTLSETDAQRSGGGGLYYHISYCGQPRSVLVTNDAQLSVMVEQMRRAYDTGTNKYWILNVGDIKPGEIAMELFMKQAWDTQSYTDATIESVFLTELGKRDFHLNDENAVKFAEVMDEYYQLTGIKRQAFFYINNGDTFAYNDDAYNDETIMFNVWANGDEGMRFIERCNAMMDALDQLYESLPEEDKPAFYQMAYYMADLLRNSAVEHISYRKNQLAASQGRYGSSAYYAELGLSASSRITDIVKRYNSQSNNKWTYMMDLRHVSVVYEQVSADRYTVLFVPTEGVGAACENQEDAGSGVLRFNSASPEDQRYFDVFDKNSVAESWIAETSAEWIVLSDYSGQVTTEQRVLVSIDWSKLDANADGTITVYNVDENGQKADAVATFDVKAVMFEGYGDNIGYVAANGYAAIEAEHYTKKEDGNDGSYWAKVVSNGQYGDTMKTMPSGDFHTEDWQNTARLRYSVYFEEAGTYTLTLNRRPTLSEGKTSDGRERSMNVAVGVGSADPTILVGTRVCVESDDTWRTNVLRQIEALTCQITVQQGWNDIVLYCVDSDFVVDRMIVRTVEGAAPVGLLGPCESPNNVPGSNTEPLCPAILQGDSNFSIILENLQENTTVTAELENVANLQVDDKNVINAIVNNGTITLTGKRAGVALVRVKFADGREGCVIAVVSTAADGNGAYYEEDGIVVINAADAMANGTSAFTTASNDGLRTWGYASGGIKATPDDGSKWDSTSFSELTGNAPAVSYGVMINNTGKYYLYTNTSVPNNGGDSYHVFVDGVYWHTVNTAQFPMDKYSWYSAGKTIDLTAGRHEITIFAREDGLTLNQVALSTNGSESFKGLMPASNTMVTFNGLSDMTLNAGEEAGTVELTATAANAAVAFSAKSGDESIAAVSVKGNALTVTPLAMGKVTVTVTADAEGYAAAQQSFTVTVMRDALHYKADGTAYEDGVTVEAWEDASAGWDHAGSTYKTYIGSPEGAYKGDFTVHMDYNTKEYQSTSAARTARIYIHDYSDPKAYWIFSVPWTSHEVANNSTLGTPTKDVTTTIPSADAAKAILKNCDVDLTICREGTVLTWNAIATAGEGTGYEGQSFTTTCTLTGITSDTLQIAISNRAFAEYTINDIKICGAAYYDINFEKLSNVVTAEGSENTTVALVASTHSGEEVHFAAQSGDESIAAVSLDNDILTVTPLTTGEVTVTVTAQAEGHTPAEQTFKVTVKEKSWQHNDESVDMVLFIGQSNMAGRGDASQATKVNEGYAYEFRAISDPTKLYPVAEPFGVNENNEESGVTESIKTGSMVSAFCQAYYAETGTPIVAVSCSKGGVPISFFDVGSAPYQDAVDRVNSAKEFLQQEYDSGKTQFKLGNVYVVWLQGESDGDQGTTAQAYTETLDRIVQGFKNDIGAAQTFVIPIGTYDGENGGLRAKYNTIRDAQIQYCLDNADATVISLQTVDIQRYGYRKDVYHYNQAGYEIIGTDAGTNMAYFAKTGNKPDCQRFYNNEPDVRQNGPWMEADGKVVISAVAALELSTYANYSSVPGYGWVKYTNEQFEGIYQNTDDTKEWGSGASAYSGAPQLHYTFQINTPGRYYLYMLASHPGAGSNSVYASIDGGDIITCTNGTYGKNKWISGETWYFDIAEAGEHTIALYTRESGIVLHQIMLSQNSAEAVTNGVEQTVSTRGTYAIHEIYKAVNGEVTIELSSALENSKYVYSTAGRADGYTDTFIWERSTGLDGVQVYPDAGVTWGTNNISPKVSYQVEFSAPGEYYIMLYSSFKDDSSDSVYVSVNNGAIMNCASSFAKGPEKWLGDPAWKITIPYAGVHTINVYPREDGAVLHKLLITKNPEPVQTLVFGDSYTSQTYWKTFDEQLASIGGQTIGVSGSEVDVWLKNAETLKIYAPKNIVIHIGVNDINRGQSGTDCGNEIVALLEKLQSLFPESNIFYVSICDNTNGSNLWTEYAASNEIVKGYIDSAQNVHYIDYAAAMKAEADNMKNKGFSDGLHPNSDGYALLSQMICDAVLEANEIVE